MTVGDDDDDVPMPASASPPPPPPPRPAPAQTMTQTQEENNVVSFSEEASVGIRTFLAGTGAPFRAVLKQRFTDFHVHEVQEGTGIVARVRERERERGRDGGNEG